MRKRPGTSVDEPLDIFSDERFANALAGATRPTTADSAEPQPPLPARPIPAVPPRDTRIGTGAGRRCAPIPSDDNGSEFQEAPGAQTRSAGEASASRAQRSLAVPGSADAAFGVSKVQGGTRCSARRRRSR